MKIELRKIVNPAAIKALETLASESVVPRSQIWPLAKTIGKIKEELGIWDKARINIFKKHGVEKDGTIEVPKEKLEQFNMDINVVLMDFVDLPLAEPIEIPTQLPEDSKLVAQDLIVLLDTGLIKEKA